VLSSSNHEIDGFESSHYSTPKPCRHFMGKWLSGNSTVEERPTTHPETCGLKSSPFSVQGENGRGKVKI